MDFQATMQHVEVLSVIYRSAQLGAHFQGLVSSIAAESAQQVTANYMNNLSNVQLEKLIYLLNNTQLNSFMNSGANHITVKPLVNQTMQFKPIPASNGVTRKCSHPLAKPWILDSGATNHITYSTSHFISCIHIVDVFV